jgi:uncharacterized membrane protein
MDDNQPPLQAAALPHALPFRAVLVPHRSLSPRGFLILMSVLGAVSFAMGLAFAWIGAWPVLGFFGIDVAVVYLAFKLNYRAARATETVEVTRDDLTVTRTGANGRHQSVTRMSATWAKLEEVEAPDGTLSLCLAQHGRRTQIARHLNSDERRSLAHALRAALRLVREPDRG